MVPDAPPASVCLIFIGKPGAGKTTLISRAFPGVTVVDVQPFVLAHTDPATSRVPEEKTIEGYRALYAAIAARTDELLILELGTNHAEFNVQQLATLTQTRRLRIYLCDASPDTCRARLAASGRTLDPIAMEARLQRDFPASHLPLLEAAGLPCTILDMEQPLEHNQRVVERVAKHEVKSME